MIKLLFTALLYVICPVLVVSAQDVTGLRLYIFDNGEISGLAPSLFNFTADEVAETDFVVTSYLIVHPEGELLWEAGAVPDENLPRDGSAFSEGPVTVSRSLRSQLQTVGYTLSDIDFFAMSHLHSDHNGNANGLAHAQWIVQKADRDVMFAGNEVGIMEADQFAALENAPTILLDNQDYDVFGDGSVRIISAPGHTPGHQVLLVNLAGHGPVLLAGDLYHYPEEITTGRFPTFEYDPVMSALSREKVDKLLQDTGAQMWIGHDKRTHAALNFAPAYYE